MPQSIIIESAEAHALKVLLPLVEKHFGDGATFLFGSRARRDYRNHSDIDLIHAVQSIPNDDEVCRRSQVFYEDVEAASVPFSVQVLVLSADRLDPDGLNPPTFPQALREMLPVQNLLDAFHDPANAGMPPTRFRPNKGIIQVPADPLECLDALACGTALHRRSDGWMLVEDEPDHPFEPDTISIAEDVVVPLLDRGFVAAGPDRAASIWRLTATGMEAWEQSADTGISPFGDAPDSSAGDRRDALCMAFASVQHPDPPNVSTNPALPDARQSPE